MGAKNDTIASTILNIFDMNVQQLVDFVRDRLDNNNEFISARISILLDGNLTFDQVIDLVSVFYVIMQDQNFYQYEHGVINKIINKITSFDLNNINRDLNTNQLKCLVEVFYYHSTSTLVETSTIAADFIIAHTTWQNVSALESKELCHLALTLTHSTSNTQQHKGVANMIAKKITTHNFYDVDFIGLRNLINSLRNATITDECYGPAIKVIVKTLETLCKDESNIEDIDDINCLTEIWHHINDDKDKKIIAKCVVVMFSCFEKDFVDNKSDIEDLSDEKKLLLIDIVSNAPCKIVKEITQKCFFENIACCIEALNLNDATIDQILSLTKVIRYIYLNKVNKEHREILFTSIAGVVFRESDNIMYARISQLLDGYLTLNQVIDLAFVVNTTIRCVYAYVGALKIDNDSLNLSLETVINKIINKIASFNLDNIVCDFNRNQFKALIYIFSCHSLVERSTITADFIIAHTTWRNVSRLGNEGLCYLALTLIRSNPNMSQHKEVADMIAKKIITYNNLYNVGFVGLRNLIKSLHNADRNDHHDSAIKVVVKILKKLCEDLQNNAQKCISDMKCFTGIWHHINDDEDRKIIVKCVVEMFSYYKKSDIDDLPGKKKLLLIDIVSNAPYEIVKEVTQKCFFENIACCIEALNLKDATIDQILSLIKVICYIDLNKKHGKILLTSIASVIFYVCIDNNIKDDDVKNVSEKVITIGGKLGNHLISMKYSNLIIFAKSVDNVGYSENARVIVNNIVVKMYNILYKIEKDIERELINEPQSTKNSKDKKLSAKLSQKALKLLKFLPKILHFATHSKELEFVTKTIQEFDVNKENNIVTICQETPNVSAKTHQLKLEQDQLKSEQDQNHGGGIQKKPKQKQKYEEKIQKHGGETQQQFKLKQEYGGKTQKKLKKS